MSWKLWQQDFSENSIHVRSICVQTNMIIKLETAWTFLIDRTEMSKDFVLLLACMLSLFDLVWVSNWLYRIKSSMFLLFFVKDYKESGNF